jgi:ribosomal protein L16 Arg81 hydroxylase
MKVIQMNDCDWMAAETVEQATDEYIAKYGGDEHELAEDQPTELSDEAMNCLMFNACDEEPPTKRTFREQLDKLIADGQEFPCFFASTEY